MDNVLVKNTLLFPVPAVRRSDASRRCRFTITGLKPLRGLIEGARRGSELADQGAKTMI